MLSLPKDYTVPTMSWALSQTSEQGHIPIDRTASLRADVQNPTETETSLAVCVRRRVKQTLFNDIIEQKESDAMTTT